MREIGERIWREPAVCIGLLVSLGLLVANLIGTPDWSAQGIIAILAPFASSLGIRQLVAPARDRQAGPPVLGNDGTTYRKLEPR